MNPRIVAIIQARMGSTRLPGKVLRTLAGQPMLARVVARARRIPDVTEVVVATTVLPEDNVIANLCNQWSCRCIRGSELDVLSRYAVAAREMSADVIVRITSDCPLLSPAVSRRVVAAYMDGGYDYVSNTRDRTFPRGLDTEIFSRSALEDADREAPDPAEREHVTPFIYWRPDRYRLSQVTDIVNRNTWRWTVDTPEDFEFTKRIYDELADRADIFEYNDVLNVLIKHPDWATINMHIEQKNVARSRTIA